MPEGRKNDEDKLRYDLIDPLFEEELAKVLTAGAIKYEPENWKVVPEAERRYYAALRRHVAAYKKGELNDPEDGLPHLGHAACCLMFMMWFDRKKSDCGGIIYRDIDNPCYIKHINSKTVYYT